MRIAIIPARGGSKRILKKNIRLFHGKPIIAYSIETAIHSGLFDHVIVSTDCPEIAKVAVRYGAQVPFLRPAALADDYCGTLAVIAHAIDALTSNGIDCSEVCCIYATAPLLQASYLQQGLNALAQADCDYAFSACEFSYPIFRSFKLTLDQRAQMFFPDCYDKRSQDLEKAYHDAGQFYWGKAAAFKAQQPIFALYSAPIILPAHLVQDIDTEADWQQAEWLYQRAQG